MKQFVPHPTVLMSFFVTFLITFASKRKLQYDIREGGDSMKGWTNMWLMAGFQHVSIGIGCVLVILVLEVRYETDFRRNVQSILRGKKD